MKQPDVIILADDVDDRMVANALDDLRRDILLRKTLRTDTASSEPTIRSDGWVIGLIDSDDHHVMAMPRFREGEPNGAADADLEDAVRGLPWNDDDDFEAIQCRLADAKARTAAMLIRTETAHGIAYVLYRHRSLTLKEAGGLLQCALQAHERDREGLSVISHKGSS